MNTLPDCGINIHRVSEILATSLGYAANAILMWMILFRTSSELKVYSRVLLVTCIIDVVFATASFVIEVVTTKSFCE